MSRRFASSSAIRRRLALAKYVKGRWREAIFLLIILPFWSNALVRTFSWTMVLREPLDLLFTYPAIVIGLVHAYLPYAILTCYISLQAIDDALIEASRSLGATTWQAFRRVILPLSMPGVLAGVFLIFVPVIGSFMEPRILGGKDAIMLGPIIEGQFNAAFNWPLGAALSFILLAIVLLILGAASPLIKRLPREERDGRGWSKIFLAAVLVFLYLPIAGDDGDGLQPLGALRAAVHLRSRLVQGADPERPAAPGRAGTAFGSPPSMP